MSCSFRRCALVALLSLLPTSLVAQIASDSVPREFVEVFLGGGMGRSELQVGRLPAELEGVVPQLPGGRVVGATRPFYGGILAVIAFDAPPNDVLRRFEEALAGEGWTHAPSPEATGGFVASDVPTYNVWCSTGSGIQPSVRWQNGVSYLRVSYSERDRSPCDADERMHTPRIDFGIDLPALVAPPGVEQRGGGRGGSSREVESTAQLQGPLPTSVLAQLYNAQLEAAGWVSVESLEGVGVSVHRYTMTGTDGGTWQGLLTLWQGGDGIIFGKIVAARPERF